MLRKKILVVGGVAGGASCAVRARRLDENADIIIFEQGSYVSFANCGLPYHIGKVIPDRESLIVATPEMFESWFNVDVRIENRVLSINPKERSIKVENVKTGKAYQEKYDSLVLSPGASPKIPPIIGSSLPGIFSLHDIPDTLSIIEWLKKTDSKRAIVLGGGFIGLELVENLANLGLSVSIIEFMDQIVPILDREMALFTQNYTARMGVKAYLECGVTKFESDKNNNGIKVYLTSGEILHTDVVIVATGVSPKNEIAVNAGLEVGKYGGIKVNRYMQTGDPNIWAVGDVVEVNEFISGDPAQIPMAGPANRQGRIAAESMVGHKTNFEFRGFRGSQATGVLGFFGMTIASTGLNERKVKEINKERKVFDYEKIHVYAYHHADYYPNAKKMVLKLIFSKSNGAVLGAQALGFSGVDKRMDVIATAIQNRATVFDLAEAELCYAPKYSSAKDIINIAGMVASNVLNGYLDIIHWNEFDPKDKIILDVRESFVYEREHFKGAINIPLDELRKNVDKLDKNKEILVYCVEGKRSYFACRILNQKGFKTRSFSGGYTMYKNDMA